MIIKIQTGIIKYLYQMKEMIKKKLKATMEIFLINSKIKDQKQMRNNYKKFLTDFPCLKFHKSNEKF